MLLNNKISLIFFIRDILRQALLIFLYTNLMVVFFWTLVIAIVALSLVTELATVFILIAKSTVQEQDLFESQLPTNDYNRTNCGYESLSNNARQTIAHTYYLI